MSHYSEQLQEELDQEYSNCHCLPSLYMPDTQYNMGRRKVAETSMEEVDYGAPSS